MAAVVCGCGTRHRSEAAAAKCPDAVPAGPVVDAEDIAGVLGLLDGRLVLTRSGGVLAVGHSLPWGPAHPGQFATVAEVFAELVAAGGDAEALERRLHRARRVGLPLGQAVPADLMAAACAALTARARATVLKSAA